MLNQKITFVLYDGITNSVFVSQVLQPILNLLKENNNIEITLVSFEKKRPSNKTLIELIPAHDRLNFILCRRLPFYGKSSLKLAIYQLKNLFKIIGAHKIISRGPLAGWISLQTVKQILSEETFNVKEKNSEKKYQINTNIKLITQARGLCAEEYRFSTQENSEETFNVKENFIIKKIRKSIYNQFNQIEKEVYRKDSKLSFIKTIESVSPALKEYLISNFNASKTQITIAKRDLPQNINEKEKQKWRKLTRNKLNIKEDQSVYCYSGSYKPWQCIPEIIEYFCKQYEKNNKSFLLMLSPDKTKLNKFLKKNKIPKTNYAILSVKPGDLYKYMAAGDIGLLFREKDIINWVSRPTKMLEYQASGLKIVHNQTIAWLQN